MTHATSRAGGSAIVQTVFGTSDDYAALVARLTLAIVIFPHGAQKLLGWFGGPGFSATLDGLGVPVVLGFLTIVAEFFGALALAVGLLTRVAALGIGAVMVGAVLLVHLPYGFFMNWFGQQQGEGFEFHLLALGLVAVVLIKGAGPFSVDRRLGAGSRRGR